MNKLITLKNLLLPVVLLTGLVACGGGGGGSTALMSVGLKYWKS